MPALSFCKRIANYRLFRRTIFRNAKNRMSGSDNAIFIRVFGHHTPGSEETALTFCILAMPTQLYNIYSEIFDFQHLFFFFKKHG